MTDKGQQGNPKAKNDLNGTSIFDGVSGVSHERTDVDKIALVIYKNAHNMYKTEADVIASKLLSSGSVISDTQYFELQREKAALQSQLADSQAEIVNLRMELQRRTDDAADSILKLMGYEEGE